MQQTKSYWRVVLVAGVVSAFLGAACTVTTSTDDPTIGEAGDGNVAGATGTAGAGTAGAGTAGAGTAGSSAAGSSSAGAAGAAGAGGAAPTPFSCDPADAGATGTPNMNACKMPSGLNDCDKCIRTKCCMEYATCYGTDPGNQCGYGGPNNKGEFFCYNSCLVDVFNANQSIEEKDKEKCAANCVTSKDVMASQDCGPVLGSATNDLIGCMADTAGGCAAECYGG
ncbi:MAG: hypothetical protein ABJB12_01520 [Pseudomonadota bacterium]